MTHAEARFVTVSEKVSVLVRLLKLVKVGGKWVVETVVLVDAAAVAVADTISDVVDVVVVLSWCC